MTKIERIRRALKGEPVDRPPVSLWRHFYEAETSAEGLARAMLEFQRKYDWDFMKVNPRASYHVEGWGTKFQFSGHPHIKPKRLDYPIKTPRDWGRLKVLSPSEGALGEQLEALKLIKEGLKKNVFFLETVFSSLSIAGDLVSSDKELVRDIREHPKSVHLALEVITETFSNFTKACLDTGAKGIFFATTEWASHSLLTEEEYREFGRPYDLEVLNQVREAEFNILHVCKSYNMLKALADYPVQALNWDATDSTNPSLKEGLMISGKAVIGGINQNLTLKKGTPEEILAEILLAKEETGGLRWILGPGCTLPTDVPEENIKLVRRAVESL